MKKLTSENIKIAISHFFLPSQDEIYSFGKFAMTYYDVSHLKINENDAHDDVSKKIIEYENVHDYTFENNVNDVLNSIKDMLLNKNRKYGNAALEPIGIFAKGNSSSLINVRIDDKLNRIKNQQEDEDEDAEMDLIGYLILKQIAKKMESK